MGGMCDRREQIPERDYAQKQGVSRRPSSIPMLVILRYSDYLRG